MDQLTTLIKSRTMSVVLDSKGDFVSTTFLRYSNFHAHLRRDALMRAIAKHIMQHVFYLLIMPNTGPIKTMEQALAYYNELMEIAEHEGFNKLQLIMTLYHTNEVTPAVIEQIAKSAIVRAIKHYPPEPGVTTGSGGGMPLEESDYQFDAMAACGVPLLGHFEATIDKYNRRLHPRDGEATMIREKVWRLRDRHPNLKICIEHASTIEAIEFVKADSSGNSFMTITPHHPTFTEHDFDHMGSDLKCKPIVQTPENQAAIDEFMVSGDERAGAGDDTAAHLKRMKDLEFDKAPNGCFYTSQGIAFYARRFIKAGAMDHRFENFMSRNAPRWWGLPEPSNDDTMTIIKSNADMPDPVPVPEDGDVVVPLGWKPQYEDQFHVGLAVQG